MGPLKEIATTSFRKIHKSMWKLKVLQCGSKHKSQRSNPLLENTVFQGCFSTMSLVPINQAFNLDIIPSGCSRSSLSSLLCSQLWGMLSNKTQLCVLAIAELICNYLHLFLITPLSYLTIPVWESKEKPDTRINHLGLKLPKLFDWNLLFDCQSCRFVLFMCL